VPYVPTRPDPVVTAMFAAYGTPVLGRSLLAARRRFVPPEKIVDMTLALCTVDPARIPAEVLAEHYAVARARARYKDGNRDFLAAARSVLATVADIRSGGYRRTIRSITAPVLMLHGEKDRLVPVAAARAAAKANPAWRLIVLNDAGHVPQLEWPEKVASAVLDWLDSAGRAAAAGAMPAES
jgi:pimeloyl-ACP methyl ester carboxylesterase